MAQSVLSTAMVHANIRVQQYRSRSNKPEELFVSLSLSALISTASLVPLAFQFRLSFPLHSGAPAAGECVRRVATTTQRGVHMYMYACIMRVRWVVLAYSLPG